MREGEREEGRRKVREGEGEISRQIEGKEKEEGRERRERTLEGLRERKREGGREIKREEGRV